MTLIECEQKEHKMTAEMNQSSRISLVNCHQCASVERQSAARQELPLMTWFSAPGQKALQQSPRFRQLWMGKRASKELVQIVVFM